MRGGCACPEPCSGKARFDSTLEILQTEDLHSIGQAGEIIYCVVNTLKKKIYGGGVERESMESNGEIEYLGNPNK